MFSLLKGGINREQLVLPGTVDCTGGTFTVAGTVPKVLGKFRSSSSFGHLSETGPAPVSVRSKGSSCVR